MTYVLRTNYDGKDVFGFVDGKEKADVASEVLRTGASLVRTEGKGERVFQVEGHKYVKADTVPESVVQELRPIPDWTELVKLPSPHPEREQELGDKLKTQREECERLERVLLETRRRLDEQERLREQMREELQIAMGKHSTVQWKAISDAASTFAKEFPLNSPVRRCGNCGVLGEDHVSSSETGDYYTCRRLPYYASIGKCLNCGEVGADHKRLSGMRDYYVCKTKK